MNIQIFHTRFHGFRSGNMICFVLAFVPQIVLAQDKQPSHSHKRVEALIAALASPNKEPKEGDGEVVFPPGYNTAPQKRIVATCEALLKEGFHAFPELVAHAQDTRYCCTMRAPNGDVNFSVGTMCQHTLRRQIEIFEDEVAGPGMFTPVYLPWIDRLPEWWKQRKTRTLRELQIEATEEALRQMKNVSVEELHRLHAGPEAAERKRTNVKKLENLLKRLKASDKPKVVTELESSSLIMIGVPAPQE